ncbi:MAG: histidinol phosphatase [Flavobacterium sp.]|uniref:tyrosine-protein phosphatase n=1 Tax=Flavobacterium sp. TaxID=239 RepID=UPI002610C650|nr:CpsB/CapC family capsule biosynthesis tyrosine phosphatase [Flavobacterium sp.]MDD5149722.1 histidinol phosphatase [Flavobacterium sp.]
MLSIFKTKTALQDLIPDNHIDIHSHLLPGIDDGARNFEDSLRLTQSLQAIGISQFITTPHIIHHVWENTSKGIKMVEEATVKQLEKHQIKVPFRAAAEYMMDDYFVELFKSEKLLTLKDNYVLVEMSYINPPIQLYEILFELQVAGYIPVLAHPERYLFYHSKFDEYQKLKKAGCLFQLNLAAVVGYYGEGIVKVAEKLLQKGMYNFVGSDAHHDKHVASFGQKVRLKDLAPLKEIISNNQFFKLDSSNPTL